MNTKWSVLACITILVVALGLSSSAVGAPTRGGRVVVALTAGWDVLDPAATAFTFSREIMGNIYDPLLIKDPETGEIKPSLVTTWTISNDGRTMILKLRQGVKFHDGTPLTAEAVAFSLNRIRDPALRSPMAATILGPVDRIEATDAFTVVISLKAPFAPFLDSLTETSLAPVSPAAVQKYGKDFGQHPVGTGPFMFKETVPNQRVTLVRNPDYHWGPAVFKNSGPAYLDELVYTVVPEDTTRIAQLVRGEVQVLYNAPAREVQRLQRNPNFKAYYKDQAGFPRSLVLNTSKWPLDDVRVRVAIATALNKAEILKTVYEGIGGVAQLPLSPVTWGYTKALEQTAYQYNPDRARQLLAEAGWRPGPDGILVKDGRPFRVRLWTTTVPQQIIEAQVEQSQLKAVGIDAQINAIEQAPYLAAIRKGDHDIAGMLFVSADPDVLFTVSHSSQIGAGWNTAFYKNPELDRLLEEGRVTTDPVKRHEIYSRVEEHLIKNVPYVPYYVIKRAFLTTAAVQGFQLDVRAFEVFHNVWMSK